MRVYRSPPRRCSCSQPIAAHVSAMHSVAVSAKPTQRQSAPCGTKKVLSGREPAGAEQAAYGRRWRTGDLSAERRTRLNRPNRYESAAARHQRQRGPRFHDSTAELVSRSFRAVAAAVLGWLAMDRASSARGVQRQLAKRTPARTDTDGFSGSPDQHCECRPAKRCGQDPAVRRARRSKTKRRRAGKAAG